MNRRGFIKSLGALALLPAMPMPSMALAPAANPAVPAATYKWAETIVRAHNKCNLGMLQRLLAIDPATASALKSELLKNGVISAQANAYGMHSAIKPLYEKAFLQSSNPVDKITGKIKELAEKTLAEPEEAGQPAEMATRQAESGTTTDLTAETLADGDEQDAPAKA